MTDTVRHTLVFQHLIAGDMELLTILIVDTIHDQMIVYRFCIYMGSHQYLITREARRKLHPDLMRHFRRHVIVGGEGLYDVIILTSILLIELLLSVK